jgi:hypothetical protein
MYATTGKYQSITWIYFLLLIKPTVVRLTFAAGTARYRNGTKVILNIVFPFLFHGTEFWVVFSSAEGFGTELWEFASILFHRTEFRVVFSSAEGFGTEFRELSVPRTRVPFGPKKVSIFSTIYCVFSRFLRNYFLSKIPNLTSAQWNRRGSRWSSVE